VKRRLDLLNKLSESGINDFDAYPIVPGRRVVPERFPVFIREANDHKGSFREISPLRCWVRYSQSTAR
jgi:hypothetical protein